MSGGATFDAGRRKETSMKTYAITRGGGGQQGGETKPKPGETNPGGPKPGE